MYVCVAGEFGSELAAIPPTSVQREPESVANQLRSEIAEKMIARGRERKRGSHLGPHRRFTEGPLGGPGFDRGPGLRPQFDKPYLTDF